MPCRDDGPVDTQKVAPAWMLCEAMTIIQNLIRQHNMSVDPGDSDPIELEDECSEQLLGWWRAHSKEEEDRIRKEAAAKLSQRELLALGLDCNGRPMKKGPKSR